MPLSPEQLAAKFKDWRINGLTRRNNGEYYWFPPNAGEALHAEMEEAVIDLLRGLGYGDAMDEYADSSGP